MAKQTILKERGTGEILYPQTLASCVQTADGGNVDDAMNEAKFKVFVDIFNAKCIKPEWGCYDPDNAPDPEHPFFLNELWLTYEDAVKSVAASNWMFLKGLDAQSLISGNLDVRTIMPIGLKTGDPIDLYGFAAGNSSIETIRIYYNISTPAQISKMSWAFYNCTKLRTIIGSLEISSNTVGLVAQSPFGYCLELTDVTIHNLCKDLKIHQSPKLSYASVNFMVANATNTSAITVTVHPDVYAKLTGDTTNEAAAALTEEEAAQWQQVLADAVAKNISFATA